VGIRPLRAINEALKTKRVWRFVTEDGAVLTKVIISKYGVDKVE